MVYSYHKSCISFVIFITSLYNIFGTDFNKLFTMQNTLINLSLPLPDVFSVDVDQQLDPEYPTDDVEGLSTSLHKEI